MLLALQNHSYFITTIHHVKYSCQVEIQLSVAYLSRKIGMKKNITQKN